MSKPHPEFREITRRLYEQVSTTADDRDWESIRPLYHERATLVRTGLSSDGQTFAMAFSFDEYIENVEKLLAGKVFRETEISQEATVFGNIARLASVYEFELVEGDQTATGRGVNFFNLINDGSGWKIMSIVWDNERPGLSLAEAGLSS
ncbi:MAG: DUF4440 domain-containing protein [Woeseiaceae bacterium]|nr:DUF4440 domain-containing protein [Woeseiaceae bacterium]